MNPRLQRLADSIESNPYEAFGHIYHPLPFPEFQHLTTSSNAGAAHLKWRLIRQCLRPLSSFQHIHVLDVGASAGFYSFNFAKLGAIVDAYEPHEHYVNVGRRIVQETGLSVRWFNKPLERTDLLDKRYDVSLMLSVFQWISQGNACLEDATDLLRMVASLSQILFFELGCNDGKSAIHTEERPIAWIWRLLKQNASPMRVAYLGSVSPWNKGRRHLFVCTNASVHLTLWQRLVTCALQRRLLR